MTKSTGDRNLLFGVLALQADLIDPAQFVEACSAWAARKDAPLADLLVERGWLSPGGRDAVEVLLRGKLRKPGGDPSQSLAAVADDEARRALAEVADPGIHEALTRLPHAEGH